MKVLVTGFDPFGGESINPAWEAVKRIRSEIAGAEIVTMQIPTVVGRSIERVHEKMKELQPDLVISVGQAGGRSGVTPERVAINVTDARIPDNDGNQPIDEPVFADGDAAYFSNLPVKAMVQAIRDAGYPSALSNSAGTYICNHVMYGILYYIHKEFPKVRGGFIHVPYAPAQTVNKPNTPSMAIADITAALEAAIEAAVSSTHDIRAVGGEIH
ncbi:MAG: pyroglutamyl-peptidase I [Sakamotonia sp.]|jgi:pyroglutamyl-peptidase